MKVQLFKKKIIVIFSITFFLFTFFTPVKAQLIPVKELNEARKVITGKAAGDIKETIMEMENILYKQKQEGTLIARTQRITDFVMGTKKNPSLILLLNSLEWSFNKQITSGPIRDRVQNLEQAVFEEEFSDLSLKERIEKLSRSLLPEGELPASEVVLPAGTSIKIKLLDKITSAEAEVGGEYRFSIVENIKVKGRLVIAENTEGTVSIAKVTKAGFAGKNGSLEPEISKVLAIDGKRIDVSLASYKEREKSYTREMAIGTSILGTAILNNPVGLIFGFFIKGHEHQLEAGTELELKTDQEVTVNGIVIE